MQYQVPQFIEIEDKIFGPLTLKQFIYLAGGGGVCLIFYTLLPFYLMIPLSIPFIGLSLALAFYRVNDRPFITTIEHAFKYFLGSKLYLWKQRPPDELKPVVPALHLQEALVSVPALSESKLKDLSWSLNIKDRSNMGVIDAKTGYKM